MYQQSPAPSPNVPFEGVRVFLKEFHEFMHPSAAEVAGVTVRAVETFRQSIAGEGFVMQPVDTLEERTTRYLDAIRASEGTSLPALTTAPFYASEEAAKLADDLYRCPRCYYVSVIPERCDNCGRHRD